MSREKGDEFEEKILDLCDEIGIIANGTKNSGSKYNDGDIHTCTTQIEAKHQGQINPSIKLKQFDKIKRQAAERNRVPVLMIENREGRAFAVLELDLFLRRYVAGEELIDYVEDEIV